MSSRSCKRIVQNDENRHLSTREFPASLLGDPKQWKPLLPPTVFALPEGWLYDAEGKRYFFLRSRFVTQDALETFAGRLGLSLAATLAYYCQPVLAEMALADEEMQVRN